VQYSFIAGSVASVAALVAFLLQLFGVGSNVAIARYTLHGSILLTLSFWLYLYFSPANRIRKAIEDRLDYSGRYLDSSNKPVDIIEGTFQVSDFGTHSIAIPPFEKPPDITIYHVKSFMKRRKPILVAVSVEAFEVEVSSSEQHGNWPYRTRGEQLKRQDNEHA